MNNTKTKTTAMTYGFFKLPYGMDPRFGSFTADSKEEALFKMIEGYPDIVRAGYYPMPCYRIMNRRTESGCYLTKEDAFGAVTFGSYGIDINATILDPSGKKIGYTNASGELFKKGSDGKFHRCENY